MAESFNILGGQYMDMIAYLRSSFAARSSGMAELTLSGSVKDKSNSVTIQIQTSDPFYVLGINGDALTGGAESYANMPKPETFGITNIHSALTLSGRPRNPQDKRALVALIFITSEAARFEPFARHINTLIDEGDGSKVLDYASARCHTIPMNTPNISRGDPRSPEARSLLEASHALMQDLFEPEENHFLSIDALCVPSIRFFVATQNGHTQGCVALANKGGYGEVKSMFVAPEARGAGLAEALLIHIEAEARAQDLSELRLETGDKLEAAIRLYSRMGYALCGPFGDYEINDSSVFMVKAL